MPDMGGGFGEIEHPVALFHLCGGFLDHPHHHCLAPGKGDQEEAEKDRDHDAGREDDKRLVRRYTFLEGRQGAPAKRDRLVRHLDRTDDLECGCGCPVDTRRIHEVVGFGAAPEEHLEREIATLARRQIGQEIRRDQRRIGPPPSELGIIFLDRTHQQEADPLPGILHQLDRARDGGLPRRRRKRDRIAAPLFEGEIEAESGEIVLQRLDPVDDEVHVAIDLGVNGKSIAEFVCELVSERLHLVGPHLAENAEAAHARIGVLEVEAADIVAPSVGRNVIAQRRERSRRFDRAGIGSQPIGQRLFGVGGERFEALVRLVIRLLGRVARGVECQQQRGRETGGDERARSAERPAPPQHRDRRMAGKDQDREDEEYPENVTEEPCRPVRADHLDWHGPRHDEGSDPDRRGYQAGQDQCAGQPHQLAPVARLDPRRKSLEHRPARKRLEAGTQSDYRRDGEREDRLAHACDAFETVEDVDRRGTHPHARADPGPAQQQCRQRDARCGPDHGRISRRHGEREADIAGDEITDREHGGIDQPAQPRMSAGKRWFGRFRPFVVARWHPGGFAIRHGIDCRMDHINHLTASRNSGSQAASAIARR